MRIFSLTAFLLPVAGTLAEQLKPFNNLHDLFSRSQNVLERRNTCSSNGYATCYSSCMPIGSDCCNSDGSFCLAGDRCDGDGCCPIGKICSGGGGGTLDYSLSYSTTTYRNHYSYTTRSYTSSSYDDDDDGDGDDDDDDDDYSYTYSAPSTRRSPTTTRASGSVGAVNADATSGGGAGLTLPPITGSLPTSTSRAALPGNAAQGLTVGAGQYFAAGAVAFGAALL